MKNSRHIYTLTNLSVCAVYPTYVIVRWDSPYATEALLAGRIAWHYTVEWNCGCHHRAYPQVSYTSAPHAVVPIAHPGEELHVRVVATGALRGDSVAVASAKISIETICNVALPWLQFSAAYNPILFDGLQLCAANSEDRADTLFVNRADITSTRHFGWFALASGTGVVLTSIKYLARQHPLPTSLVYILAVTGVRASATFLEVLSPEKIAKRIRTHNACVVLCGIGELGLAAVAESLSILGALMKADNDRSLSSIFCISYGSARYYALSCPTVLQAAACYSGHFLFYSGTAVRSADDASEFSSKLAGATALPSPMNKPNDEHLNVPLGVQCCPIIDDVSGCTAMATEMSFFELAAREEHVECLDVAHHLKLLERLLLPKQCELVPHIAAASCLLDEAGILTVTLRGTNLQHSPHALCLCDPGATPVEMKIVSNKSDAQCWSGCAVTSIFHASAVNSGGHPATLSIQFFLHTDMGTEETVTLSVEMPPVLGRLLQCAVQPRTHPRSWVCAFPAILLQSHLELISFTTGCGRTAVRLLSAMATASEIAAHQQANRHLQTGLFAFVANMAARVTAPTDSSLPAVKIPPLTEARFLERTLQESPPCDIMNRLQPWVTRMVRRIPGLVDACYKAKLQWLMLILGGTDTYVDYPLVVVEWMVQHRVRMHLQRCVDVSDAFPTERISDCMSFEKFYDRTVGLFLPCDGDGVAQDVIFLWAVVLVAELRIIYLTTRFVAVTGCRGSGCSTIATALVEHLTVGRRDYRDTQVVCVVPEQELSRLQSALRLGMCITTLVVGELPDFIGSTISALAKALRSRQTDEANQPVHLVMSKVDEHMAAYEDCTDLGNPDTTLPYLGSVVGYICGESQVHAVALAPSTHCMLRIAEKRGITVGVAELLAAYQRASQAVVIGLVM